MATALADENTAACANENTTDLEESQNEDPFLNGLNIESFIDDEFRNLFDSESDLDEESPFDEDCTASSSSSSRILVQQLQKFKASNCIDNGDVDSKDDESGVVVETRDELEQEPSKALQKCERCERLQLQGNNASSLDSGIGDGHKDEPGVREMVVTDDQIVDMLDEIGNVWKILGPILNIKMAKIKNIDADYARNADKASCLLTTWKEQEGRSATVGNLESALLRIKRKDIADKFLDIVGISAFDVHPIQVIDKPLHLNIRVGLTTEYNEPDTSVLLCEDSSGRKYLVKEITDEKTEWNIEKIVDNEMVMERMIKAAQNSRKTKEERRQESLRRVSAELTELRRRMKRVRIESENDEKDEQDKDTPRPKSDSPANNNKITSEQSQEMLRMCIIQSESSQMMYRVLIKLIGEVGPLKGNSRCLRQLSDFTNELREQERKLVPKLYMLDGLKDKLEEEHLAVLERLQKWQQTQNKQVEGIDKLITSLLEQGKIRWNRKASNRKSEPVFKFGGSIGVRKRAKTDSCENKKQYLSSLQDERNEERKKQISSPLCARQMQKM